MTDDRGLNHSKWACPYVVQVSRVHQGQRARSTLLGSLRVARASSSGSAFGRGPLRVDRRDEHAIRSSIRERGQEDRWADQLRLD